MHVRQLYEPNWDKELSALLLQAVSESGRTRVEIGKATAINKDFLRRILSGERPAIRDQVFAILNAADTPPSADLILILASRGNAIQSFRGDISQFLKGVLNELMSVLEHVLGNQVCNIKPRGAKGAAHRLARIFVDHIDKLERRDALANV